MDAMPCPFVDAAHRQIVVPGVPERTAYAAAASQRQCGNYTFVRCPPVAFVDAIVSAYRHSQNDNKHLHSHGT